MLQTFIEENTRGVNWPLLEHSIAWNVSLGVEEISSTIPGSDLTFDLRK